MPKRRTIKVRESAKVVETEKEAKVWQNFQLSKELRDKVAEKAFKSHTNLSAFYRQCAEIFLKAGSNRDALANVEALVNEMTFTRPTADR